MNAPRRVLVPILAALAACSSPAGVPSGPSIEAVTGPAPSLAGETLQGGTLAPDATMGRVTVVNFWATWCGPCRREQPVLSSVQAEQGSDGAAFVGVNFRDDPAAARGYLEEFDVAYPSLVDAAGTLAYRFGVPFLPTTVVIGADGRLRFRVTGEIDAPTLREVIARASDGGGSADPAT